MKKSINNILPAIMMILFGTLSSMIVGFLFFGPEIFNQQHPAFQFVVFGFWISALISIGEHFRMRIFAIGCILFILFITFAMNLLIFEDPVYLLRDLVFGISIALSIFVGLTILGKTVLLKSALNKIMVWLLSVIVAYMITTIILSIIHSPPDVLGYFQIQIAFAVLIGLGVSIGTTGAGIIFPKAVKRKVYLLI